MIDQPDRFGFAYGTLPGHPGRGESAFVVAREPGGTIFRIESFSRPVDPLARLGRPLARRIQLRVTRRYLEALAAGM